MSKKKISSVLVLAVVVAAGVLLLLPGTASAYPPWWTLQQAVSGGGNAMNVSVETRGSHIWVVWQQWQGSPNNSIWYAHSSDYGRTYSTRCLADGYYSNDSPEVVIGPAGYVYVIWSWLDAYPGGTQTWRLDMLTSEDNGETFPHLWISPFSTNKNLLHPRASYLNSGAVVVVWDEQWTAGSSYYGVGWGLTDWWNINRGGFFTVTQSGYRYPVVACHGSNEAIIVCQIKSVTPPYNNDLYCKLTYDLGNGTGATWYPTGGFEAVAVNTEADFRYPDVYWNRNGANDPEIVYEFLYGGSYYYAGMARSMATGTWSGGAGFGTGSYEPRPTRFGNQGWDSLFINAGGGGWGRVNQWGICDNFFGDIPVAPFVRPVATTSEDMTVAAVCSGWGSVFIRRIEGFGPNLSVTGPGATFPGDNKAFFNHDFTITAVSTEPANGFAVTGTEIANGQNFVDGILETSFGYAQEGNPWGNLPVAGGGSHIVSTPSSPHTYTIMANGSAGGPLDNKSFYLAAWSSNSAGFTTGADNKPFKVYVDHTPPTAGTMNVDGEPSMGETPIYKNSNFALEFTNVQDNLDFDLKNQYFKGVKKVEVTCTGVEYYDFGAISPENAWGTTIDISKIEDDGTYHFKGVITDVAGNNSEVVSGPVVIDRIEPKCTLIPNNTENDLGWRNTDTKVVVDPHDANVDTVEYKLSGEGAGKGAPGWTTFLGPIDLPDGQWTIECIADDKAGNIGSVKAAIFKVDTTSPSCAVTEPVKDFIQTGFTKDQKARISGFAEDGCSGIASESLYMGSSKIAIGSGGEVSCDWDVSNINQGLYEIKVVSSDYAGNHSTATKYVNVANFCKDWYFAEGNTLPEFDEWLCIANPGEEGANVQLSFMLETGEVITREVTVARKARTTYKVKSFVPEGHPGVSTRIHCDTQAVIAERAMYFNYKAADPSRNWKGGHASLGLTTLQKEFYFAEGTTRSNVVDGQFDEWLTLQNPGNKTGTVNITYMLGDGRNIYKQYTVGPHSRVTVDVPPDVGKDQDVSARVLSDEPIAAERPMYFDYHGYAREGHNVVGTSSPSTEWLFAEGNTLSAFQMWLTVQNPNDIEAHLTFRYLTDQGKVVDVKRTVGPRSRWTEDVLSDVGDSQNFSTEIHSDVPVVCERPMYFNYKEKWTGGHDAMGSTSLSTKFYVAEGTTIDGFETWYTIGNPNGSAASVKIKFMSGSGEVIPREFEVAPHSRLTIDVNAEVGQGKDVSSYIDSDKPVMVERPMYFNYGGTRDGGSDSPAYGVD